MHSPIFPFVLLWINHNTILLTLLCFDLICFYDCHMNEVVTFLFYILKHQFILYWLFLKLRCVVITFSILLFLKKSIQFIVICFWRLIPEHLLKFYRKRCLGYEFTFVLPVCFSYLWLLLVFPSHLHLLGLTLLNLISHILTSSHLLATEDCQRGFHRLWA